ncbi:transglutaminase-like domain-containing protein [Polynucleobacter asymbioticus]|jgi:hypothetical protein|uniref:Transglutaminase-like domain-containing protein n=1 Tax=Polynucleobacter asymbioticus TaxID=576611 RepID=A0AAC9ITY1_9BURK|nr:transglutaminase-like domain-containing protein [Polynucleobacter asymbioticus]APB98227.1 hypothetical protein A4F89_02175 [Polynucleobacter asymbioticus]APC00513.1 hypothetical protein AOC25_02180 [Polynucleobacter asymbioticus]
MDKKILFENIHSDKALRTIDETEIIEMLLVWGFIFELKEGLKNQSIHIIKNTLKRFIGHGLPFETSLQRRLFDPTEVINFMKWLDLTQQDFFWSDYVVPTGQKLVKSLAKKISGSQEGATYTPSLSFTRAFNLLGLGLGKRIRLRIPTGISESDFRNINIDFDGLNHRLANNHGALSKHQNYLQLDIVNFYLDSVRIHYDCIALYTQYKEPSPSETGLSPDEHHLYTQSVEGFIRVSDRIKSLSHTIAGHHPPNEQVHALWGWIMDNMLIGLVHYHRIDKNNPMDWALDQRIVDCQLGSALLISFCRALGIPARLVGGYTLYSEAPSQHFWAQIWLPITGWCSYDLITWDLSRGGLLEDWRNIFEGNIDPRFITEIFPRNIIGNIGLPFPSRHHRLVSSTGNGINIQYREADTGHPVYNDTISVSD